MADIATLNGVGEADIASINGHTARGSSVNGVTWPDPFSVSYSGEFTESSSSHLYATFTATGNVYKSTFSWWFKRKDTDNDFYAWLSADVSTESAIYTAHHKDDLTINLRAGSDNVDTTNGSGWEDLDWHHVLIHFDTTNGTAADRQAVYLDGTSVSLSSTFASSSNTQFGAAADYKIGIGKGSWEPANAYIAEVYRIDNANISVTSFRDASTGSPLLYEGDPGTNGWYLNFSNSSDLGEDQSVQGNDFSNSNVTQSTEVPT